MIHTDIIKNIMLQFGENVPIKKMAQYAHDEFEIPYELAVKIIYDNT